MKKMALLVINLQIIFLPVFAQLKVQNLLIENLVNPIGIDVQQPRFSWQLSSPKRNTLQAAYEIKLSSGKKEVWSTGKVASPQSVLVPYGGPALQSTIKYQWQVRTWDNNGGASEWSAPATFQMALLNKEDWKAKWIEADFAEDTVNRPAQYFRKGFTAKKKIRSATAFITAHGMYEAEINGKRVGDCYPHAGLDKLQETIAIPGI
jgi:alpha-L-rhamnosidase